MLFSSLVIDESTTICTLPAPAELAGVMVSHTAEVGVVFEPNVAETDEGSRAMQEINMKATNKIFMTRN